MRDYKFAIKDLRGLAMFEHREEFIHTMDVESINLAIEALEYRTPKDVIKRADKGTDGKPVYIYECPTCKRVLYSREGGAYCRFCGQALRWPTEVRYGENI